LLTRKVRDAHGAELPLTVFERCFFNAGMNFTAAVVVDTPPLGFTTLFFEASDKSALTPSAPLADVQALGGAADVSPQGLVALANKSGKMSVSAQLAYYRASVGNDEDRQASGAYIFRYGGGGGGSAA
jgi:hypothetical protein